jgi:pimeloyl-ACP methyl ester carboxylesterase
MRRLALIALIAGVLATDPAMASTGPGPGRHSYTGTLAGAAFRVETPQRWNGRLVLYSHGYLPAGFPDFGIALTNRPPDRSESEKWLLDHGYALAASQFPDKGIGYQVESALHDQLALLDWFDAHVGRPRETVATGQSLGTAVALLLAERHPDRISGAATMCGAHDPLGTFNAELDVNFAIKTLLAPGQDVPLVKASDPGRSADLLAQAAEQARSTPQGRARLALAGALNNIVGWDSAHNPRPSDPLEWSREQATWIEQAYIRGRGPVARADLERRAGGNGLWNVGVDYAHQLARSSQRELVVRAYHAAGLSLRRDLDRLAGAPRISPDKQAVAYLYRYGVPTGRIAVPVITMHSIGDGGAVPDQERWYGDLVRHAGRGDLLRQIYVDRGMHCSFSAADEIVELRTLFDRIDAKRWPETSPARLNAMDADLGQTYQLVLDFSTFQDAPMPPAFTAFTPPWPLRPSR